MRKALLLLLFFVPAIASAGTVKIFQSTNTGGGAVRIVGGASGGTGGVNLGVSVSGSSLTTKTDTLNFSSRTFTVTQSPTGHVNITGKIDTTGAAVNWVYTFNGSSGVWAPAGTDFSFAIASFTDGQAAIIEQGVGVWKAAGAITYAATYTNGPATSATVNFPGWGGGLTLAAPYSGGTNQAAVNFPTVGGAVVFTLNAAGSTGSDTATITHAFYNRRFWGVSTVASGFTEANVEALAGSDLSNSLTNSFAVSPGAEEYIVFAYPVRLGLARPFFGMFEGGFEAPEVVNITNASLFAENYYVWRSTNKNLGSVTITTQP